MATGWNNFWTGVKTGGSNAWANLQNIWSGCVGWFKSSIISPVSSAFKGLWEGIKSFLTNPLEGIKTMFSNAFNWIIGKVNALIGGLNKIKLPDFLGGGGINIPKIPTLWKGSNYTMGGLTLVGEQGPELLTLPRGASVTPAHKTEQMLNSTNTTPQQISVIVQTTLDGKVLAETVTPYTDIVSGNRLNLSKRGVLV